MVMHLNHCEEIQPKRQQHKLEDGVPVYDRQPPPGVRTMDLDELRLSMHISGSSSRKRRKLEPSLDESKAQNEESVDDNPYSHATSDDHSQRAIAHIRFSKLAPPCQRRGTPFRRSKTSPARDCPPDDNAEMLMGLGTPPGIASKETLSLSDSTRKRSYSTGDLRSSVAQPTHCDHLLEICDAGLRAAISSSPGRLPTGVRVVSNESFKHFAETFPSLWSPGYLAAVSSRAALIPTIEHALGEVCGKHARNTTLRAKIAEVHRRNLSSYDSVPVDRNPSSSRQARPVAARLWMAMQNSLFEKDAARSFRPLGNSVEGLVDEDEPLWPESELGGYCTQDEDIDDLVSCGEESILDDERLTPDLEAGDDIDLLWNDIDASEGQTLMHDGNGHVADGKHGLHVDETWDDEVLSLCESVDSILLDGAMNVALDSPDGCAMPSEKSADVNLFASWKEDEVDMVEMLPI